LGKKRRISVRKFVIIFLAIASAVALFVFLSVKRDERRLKAFVSESQRHIRFRSLTFDGQQRTLRIEDSDSLACIAAGVTAAKPGMRTGVSYRVIFELAEGTKIETFVFLSGSHMTIAGDMTGDPRYYLVTLPTSIPAKLAGGLSFLEAEVPKEKDMTIQ
jgi:hypothetical protein